MPTPQEVNAILDQVYGGNESPITTIKIGLSNTPKPDPIAINQVLDQVYGFSSTPNQKEGLGFIGNTLGALRSVLSGPTLGFEDNITSAIAAPIVSALSDQTTSDAYSGLLNQARQQKQQFREENPKLSTILELGGALTPAGIGAGSLSIGNTLGKRLLSAIGTGALGRVGESNTDIGSSESLNKAGQGALVGGLVGGALEGGIALTNAATKGLDPSKLRLTSFGITPNDLKLAAKGKNEALFRETTQIPLEDTLIRADSEGLINASKDAGENVLSLSKAIEEKRQPLVEILNQAQQVLDDNNITNLKVRPSASTNFIRNKVGESKDEAIKAIQSQMQALEAQGVNKGSLLDLQNIKGALQHDAYMLESPYKMSAAKAIASDYRKTIEDTVDALVSNGKLPSEYAGKVRQINDELSNLYELKDIFLKKIPADKLSTTLKGITNFMKTTGGKGALLVGGSALGSPLLGLAAAGGLHALQSKTGQNILANAIEGASNLGQYIPKDIATAASKGAETLRNRPTTIINALTEPNAKSEKGFEIKPKDFYLQPKQEEQQQGDLIDMGKWNKTPTSLSEEDFTKLSKAVAKQESGADLEDKKSVEIRNKLVSEAGARGVFQLMPATAKDIAEQLGEKYDPTDAKQNIRFGKYYLEKLLNRYEGNVELALAAYNWGMGNLEKSIDKHADKVIGEDGSIDIFALPNLPKETQNYVKNITKRYYA